MANALRGEASFEAEGKTYRLKYDWNSAAVFETEVGIDLGKSLIAVLGGTSARCLRGLLWAGLREHHHEVTLAEAGRLIGVLGRKEATRIVGVGLRYYFPELPPQAAEPDPPRPAGGA